MGQVDRMGRRMLAVHRPCCAILGDTLSLFPSLPPLPRASHLPQSLQDILNLVTGQHRVSIRESSLLSGYLPVPGAHCQATCGAFQGPCRRVCYSHLQMKN